MNKIEKIRAEIEMHIKHYEKLERNAFRNGELYICQELLFFIDSLQEEPDKTLEDAAEEYEKEHTYQRYDGGGLTPEYDATLAESFIAGAKWQAEQDDRDVVFWKGMQHAIEGMKKDAVEGVIIDSGFDDGTAFVTMNIPDRRYDRGDKVKLIIIKDDGKSD